MAAGQKPLQIEFFVTRPFSMKAANGIQLSHIFYILSITIEILSISIDIPSISIDIPGISVEIPSISIEMQLIILR